MRRLGTVNFDHGWLACAGDVPQAETVGYNDSKWHKIDLPHDWSAEQHFDSELLHGHMHAYLPNGIVWYRKYARIEYKENERVFLEFDGIYRSPDIFVNGKHLLKKFNGFIGFELDISDAVQPGENLIAVRVDNSAERSSRWYTGTGINRNVRLSIRKKLHFLRNGIFVNAQGNGSFSVEAEANSSAKIVFRISDQNGKELLVLNADNSGSASGKIESPALWSPESPALYKCTAQLLDENGQVSDELSVKFGFRSVEFSPEQGFILNGKKVLLRGVNLHEDLCGLGTALFKDGIRRRYANLKSWGVNAIRLAHHPYAPEWMDLADEMGLLIFAEAFDKWTDQYNGWQVPFEETWRDDITEFIRSNRNHPSIFIWSMGNEPYEQQIEGPDHYGVDIFVKLRDFARKLDPSRKITAGLYPARRNGICYNHPDYMKSEIAELAHEMDVVSANYMGMFFANDHKKHPEMVFLVSEEATSKGAAKWFDFDHEIGCGSFFWGGYDYLGEAHWPHKNWYRGLVDRAGFRKPISYHAEAAWLDKPLVHLSVLASQEKESKEWNDVILDWADLSSHWNWTEGKSSMLAISSNCEKVELHLNGRLLETLSFKKGDFCRVKCEIPFEPGELVAKAFKSGKLVAENKLITAGKAEKLFLRPLKYGNESDRLIHVELEVQDAKDIRCPVNPLVHFKVSGAGMLRGVVNGDTKSNQRFNCSSLKLHEGRGLAVVCIKESGKISFEADLEIDGKTIRASADL